MRSEGQRLLCQVEKSLAQIAVAAGCSSKQSVANWKAGTKAPERPYRDALEAAYGIPVESWVRAPAGSSEPAEAASRAVPNLTTTATPSTASDLDALIAFLRTELGKPDILASERVKLSSSMTSALALRHRLEKEQELLEDRIIREHPAWARIQAALLRALVNFPDAAKAVAAALAAEGFER